MADKAPPSVGRKYNFRHEDISITCQRNPPHSFTLRLLELTVLSVQLMMKEPKASGGLGYIIGEIAIATENQDVVAWLTINYQGPPAL